MTRVKKTINDTIAPMNKTFSIVVAYDQNQGIGNNNTLPWHLPKDMAYFKTLTSQAKHNHKNLVIMGRNTWESIPLKYRPLPNRYNMVISKNPNLPTPPSVLLQSNLDHLLGSLDSIQQNLEIDQIFIIGGMSLYKQAIHHPLCSAIYATEIGHSYTCDAFFPSIPPCFKVVNHIDTTDNSISISFKTYQRCSML
jgi:dihydrofolate reductase